MNKTIFTNGTKSFDMAQYPPEAWTWYSGDPTQNIDTELYSKVAAVYRALELTANATASLPFAVVDQSGNDYDISSDWQNKIGFMPKPQNLLRLWRMSLFMTNTAYGRYADTKTFQGRAVKRELLYVVSTSITPHVSTETGDLDYFIRTVNGQTKQLKPKELFYIFKQDFTTELLPSKNTEFKALMQSAGILFFADKWVSNFFERGGVRPAIISVKGMVIPTDEKKNELQSSWGKFIRNVSREIAKVINGDAMDVKQIGDGVGDLKDTPVYRQAIENVAIAAGMPLSLLLSNSANYATAQVEYSNWYRNNIVPTAQMMAEWMNDQIFTPMGLHFEFRPEMSEPNQQEEAERAGAFAQYVSSGIKPSIAAQIVGIDLPAGMEYDELDPEEAEPETVPPQDAEAPETVAPAVEDEQGSTDDTETETKGLTFDAWKELEIWKRKATKAQKRGEPLPVEFVCEHIPAGMARVVRSWLAIGDTVKAFEMQEIQETKAAEVPQVAEVAKVENTDIKDLADALNNATKAALVPQPKDIQPIINVTMPTINLTAQMPEQGAPSVTVNIPEQPAPIVNVTNEVTAPSVNNTVKVPPTKPVQKAKVIRDANGAITGIEAQ